MIIVFSLKDCKWCDKFKKYLKKTGKEFVEKNIMGENPEENREYKRELGKLIHLTAETKFPVVCVGIECVEGYEISKFEEILTKM